MNNSQLLPENLKIPTGTLVRSKNKTPIKAECMCGLVYECLNGWAVCPKCSKDGTFSVNKWEQLEYSLYEEE